MCCLEYQVKIPLNKSLATVVADIFVTYVVFITLAGPLVHPHYATSTQFHCHIREKRSSVFFEDIGEIRYNSSRDKTEN